MATPTSTRSPLRLSTVVSVVVLGLLLAELGVRGLEGRMPPAAGWISDEYGRKIEQMEDVGRAGVVVVGSSVAGVSVDPTLFPEALGDGPHYNAGLIGATPRIVEVWTREVVLPELDPTTVVVAVSSRDVNGNGIGIASSDDLFEHSAGGRHLLGTESLADRVEWWIQERSALVRQRQNLRRPLEAIFDYDAPSRSFAQLTDAGLRTDLLDLPYRDDETALAFFRREPLHDFAVAQDQVAALDRVLDELRSQGRRAVLLDVPVTADYVDLHPRGAEDYAAYQAAIDALAAENGAEVLRPGLWPVELFSDPLHLNRAGVERLSAELGAYLS